MLIKTGINLHRQSLRISGRWLFGLSYRSWVLRVKHLCLSSSLIYGVGHWIDASGRVAVSDRRHRHRPSRARYLERPMVEIVGTNAHELHRQKAAALLIALGPEVSSAVLKIFNDDDINGLTNEIVKMRQVPSDVRDTILQRDVRRR